MVGMEVTHECNCEIGMEVAQDGAGYVTQHAYMLQEVAVVSKYGIWGRHENKALQ